MRDREILKAPNLTLIDLPFDPRTANSITTIFVVLVEESSRSRDDYDR